MYKAKVSELFCYSDIVYCLEEIIVDKYSLLKEAGKLSSSMYSSKMRGQEVENFKLFKYKDGYSTFSIDSCAEQVDIIPLYPYYLCIPVLSLDAFKFKPLKGFYFKGFNTLTGVNKYLRELETCKVLNKYMLDFSNARLFEFIPYNFPYDWQYKWVSYLILDFDESCKPYMYNYVTDVINSNIDELYDLSVLDDGEDDCAASEYAEDGEYV